MISKRLVNKMDGDISISSQSGQGTKFLIEFKGVNFFSNDTFKGGGEKEIDHKSIVFEKRAVLIADSLEFNRELLKGYLESYELELVEAVSGKDVLRKSREQSFDLILLDMKMPDMDAFEIATSIKNSEAFRNVPIVAVTALAMKGDEEIIRKYCDSYLKKPVSRADLLNELMKYISYTVTKSGASKQIIKERGKALLNEEVLLKYPEIADVLEKREDELSRLIIEKRVDKIEVFAKEMIEVGDEYGIIPLKEWADVIIDAIAELDIQKINNYLENIRSFIVDNIKK